ncbi:MAG: GAF domain-containing sensor histidine kinase [Chloroflexota bacterium]
MRDKRIPEYIAAAAQLKQGQYQIEVSLSPSDEISTLGEALRDLAQTLEVRYQETQQVGVITAQINAGLMLDEILEAVYHEFRAFIPYNRIGFSLIENNGQTVRACWAKTDQPAAQLKVGYSAPLQGSSLETIIRTGQPRILNDLEQYLQEKPGSESSQLILAEGIRSSLTCPLIVNGVPVGFMFFSSVSPNTYAEVHVEIFQRIASQLSVIVEKGRLVSELAIQKQAIERQNDELHHLNELKNAFLGMAAHDLRNPLSNIMMALDLLLESDGKLSEEIRQSLLEDSAGQTDYMLRLLNDLLDVSHIESGKFTINAVETEVEPFLRNTVRWHQQLAQAKSIQVQLTLDAEGVFWVDPTRLRQVLDNLISNAVKFSPPGSSVYVRVLKSESEWRLEVQDQGPGLTDEDKQRLFQHFARLSAHPTAGEKSTGLGLAITRQIVEAHGGAIGVESTPGQGATFWVSLPTNSVPAMS